MKRRTNYLILFLLAAVGILALPFLPLPEGERSHWNYFIGRFHILLVHFPVVMILVLVALELWEWRSPAAQWGNLLPTIWGISLFSCFFTVLAGYSLLRTGEYQGELVGQHLWGGVILSLCLILATLIRFEWISGFARVKKIAYPTLLLALAGLVIYTSHLGGSLTHGPDFLTEHAPQLRPLPSSEAEQKPVTELLVFQDLLLPALENRCISCHNENKTKGDLLMTSFAALQKGGKSAKPMLVAGEPEASEMYHRILLPLSDDDRMPPNQKTGLSEDEVALLHWWITEGASPEMKLGEGPPGPDGPALMERYLPQLFQAQRLKLRQAEEMEALSQELAKVGEKLQLIIEPDVNAPGYFAVSQTIPPGLVNNESLVKLRPYATLISKLSLPGSDITDDGLYEIARMTNLQQLYLPKTCINGEGLAYLQSLKSLRTLNLSFSFLKDEGVLKLLDLSPLKKVYLFGTEVHPNVLEAIRKNSPTLQLLEEEGPYF